MRGSPPIQLFLLLLAFGLAGIVLSRLTRAESPVAKSAVKSTAPVTRVKARLRIEWAGKLEKLQILHEDRDLASKADLASESAEFKIELPDLKKGIELQISAKWPTGTPKTALSIEIEPDGHDSRSLLRWTEDASLEDILVFSW
ncbi:MAG: hypothetical protein IPK32_12365 [Verrucomicrobiaceae bacterium]|nr:hypothetical protein [Verrucomicrobiaceae bacterium]